MEKINLEKLKAANFSIATFEDLKLTIQPKGDMEAAKNFRAEIIKEINKYLKIFAAPIEHRDKKNNQFLWRNCLNCDHALTGLFGSFEYGIAHGEGHCSKCGYPCRADHYIEHEGFKLVIRNHVLQYHPSQLERKKKKNGND